MKLQLKHWILFALVSCVLCLGVLFPKHFATSATDGKTLHVLNRLTFGPRQGDIELVQFRGIKAYIQSQLAPETLSEPLILQQQLNRLETLNMSPVESLAQYKPPKRKDSQNVSKVERRRANQRSKIPLRQAQQANLLRDLYSPKQLQEMMVDFWFYHFNVFSRKGNIRFWVGNYEQTAIRSHALGHFRDLLGATAHHPAMLLYLDNASNSAPTNSRRANKKLGLNENYARELMELHTLGVDGGYTQNDVITLARIFTGWGVDPQGKHGNSGFYFAQNRHDSSNKVFLGQQIPGGGIEEGEQALDILARHPATARHISYKLAQYFVTDEPPAALVKRLAKRFQETDGEIRLVLETLFQSPEFWDAQYYGSKFKTPYQYIVSALRIADIKQPNFRRIIGTLQQLGMLPYGCLTPNGYKNTQDAWLNSDAMLRRVSFATALAKGRFSEDEPANTNQMAQTLGNNFSVHTQQVMQKSPAKLRSAILLGSPEMMKK